MSQGQHGRLGWRVPSWHPSDDRGQYFRLEAIRLDAWACCMLYAHPTLNRLSLVLALLLLFVIQEAIAEGDLPCSTVLKVRRQ